MSRILSPRCCTLKRVLAGLSICLFFAGSFFRTGDLLAAPRARSTGADNHSVGRHASNDREGVRYIYVKVRPGKDALPEQAKRDRRHLPHPKFAKLIHGKHPAVVRIDVEGEGNVTYHGSGTLVAVSETKGVVITNWHVIRDGAGEIFVRFPDGLIAKATVLKTDNTWDLAALSITRPRVRPVKLSEGIPQIGDALTVAGYGGGTYRQSSGRLLQYCAPGMTDPAEIIEVTTAARNGDSGGPIFAQDGTLAGVLFGSISGTTNGSHAGRVRTFLKSVLVQSPYAKYNVRERRVSYESSANAGGPDDFPE